jgi:hypothetical protein
MRLFSLKTLLVCTALAACLGMVAAEGATKAKPAPKPSGQKVSMLGGKFLFTLPKDYVKGPMEEIDAKARAAGVTGSMYMNKPAKRVVIITEAPLPNGQKVGANDKQTLDGIIADTLQQQQTSYRDFKKLGEKKIVRKGFGMRQLDIAGSVDGGRVLSTTVTAAYGKRTAMVNVISLAKDAKAHADVVKGVTGGK